MSLRAVLKKNQKHGTNKYQNESKQRVEGWRAEIEYCHDLAEAIGDRDKARLLVQVDSCRAERKPDGLQQEAGGRENLDEIGSSVGDESVAATINSNTGGFLEGHWLFLARFVNEGEVLIWLLDLK